MNIIQLIDEFNQYAKAIGVEYEVDCCLPLEYNKNTDIYTLKMILACKLNKYDYAHLDYYMKNIANNYIKDNNNTNLINITYAINEKTNNSYYIYSPMIITGKIDMDNN